VAALPFFDSQSHPIPVATRRCAGAGAARGWCCAQAVLLPAAHRHASRRSAAAMDDDTFAWCLFQQADEDESGTLDRCEIKALARNLGMSLTEQHLDDAMRQMDIDGGGTVDFSEFSKWFATASDAVGTGGGGWSKTAAKLAKAARTYMEECMFERVGEQRLQQRMAFQGGLLQRMRRRQAGLRTAGQSVIDITAPPPPVTAGVPEGSRPMQGGANAAVDGGSPAGAREDAVAQAVLRDARTVAAERESVLMHAHETMRRYMNSTADAGHADACAAVYATGAKEATDGVGGATTTAAVGETAEELVGSREESGPWHGGEHAPAPRSYWCFPWDMHWEGKVASLERQEPPEQSALERLSGQPQRPTVAITWQHGDVYEGEWCRETGAQAVVPRLIWLGYPCAAPVLDVTKLTRRPAGSGRPDGEGVFVFSDGTSFQGRWKQGRRHGQGQERSRDGDVYTGGWRNDARHGFGLLEYASGSRYEGGWRDGAQHGFGRFETHGGLRYCADMHEGRAVTMRPYATGALEWDDYEEPESWMSDAQHEF
jgi:hypothetical protein